MAKWDHVNAHDVYPPDFLTEIQKYFSDGYLRSADPWGRLASLRMSGKTTEVALRVTDD